MGTAWQPLPPRPTPYEVHILKAPDGYEKPSETYLLPKEGGSLIIQLNAQ